MSLLWLDTPSSADSSTGLYTGDTAGETRHECMADPLLDVCNMYMHSFVRDLLMSIRGSIYALACGTHVVQ